MLDFSRFKVLTFDCYGTLINWEDGILSCMRRIMANHGTHADDATILKLYGDFEAGAEHGEYVSYREVLRSVVRRFGEQFDFVPAAQEMDALPDSLPHWEPWPDTVEALRNLESHFRLAIISNVDDDLFASTKPQLGAEFYRVTTAQQARAYKPSLKIFELALNRIGVPTQQVLHVGQSLYHDVIPAQSLGLATVWVNRPSARGGVGAVKAATATPDLEVRSVAELAACTLESR
jgi:2-haloacid dehalogenase